MAARADRPDPGGGGEIRLTGERLWTEARDGGLYAVYALVKTSQGRRTVASRVALTVNGIARSDAGAVAETDALDGQAILTTIIDPALNGNTVEINAIIPRTTTMATPRRLLFTGTSAVEYKPVRTVTARPTGVKSNLQQLPFGVFDEDGNPTIGTARVSYGECAVDHCVGLDGLVLPFTVPDGESLSVTIECPGATPATVTLQGRDKPSPTPRPARVQLGALPSTWDETTGASSTVASPRAYDADANGAECSLYFSTTRPITVIVYDEGVAPVTHTGLRGFQIVIEKEPTSSYEFRNEHGEPIAVNCDIVGFDGAIDNMVLPAAEPRPGAWRAGMTSAELRRYFRLGGK